MKITFKIFGILLILAIGVGFIFYGLRCHRLNKAEKAYNYGDFETTIALYEEGIKNLGKQPISKIPPLRNEVEGLNLIRAWSFYYQGYYEPEKYDLAEKIANRELKNEKSFCKDQLYNLQALICWQKGVELFIKLGKKAFNSKELDEFLEGAKTNSQEAVNFNNGKDWDIKYNWEFFRKDKRELKKNMQQQAKQKQKDREMREKVKEQAEKRESDQEKQAEGQQKAQGKKMDKEKDEEQKAKILVPTDKETEKKSEDQPGTSQVKKKKKG